MKNNIRRSYVYILFLVIVIMIVFVFYHKIFSNEIQKDIGPIVTSDMDTITHVEVTNEDLNVAKDKENKPEYFKQDLNNHIISPFPLEINETGLASIYPISPFTLYQKNITNAEKGNAKAQLLVARALKECKGVSDKEKIQMLKDQNVVIPEIIASLEAHLEYCAELVQIIPLSKLNDWNTHYKWLIDARNNGDINAEAWYFDIHPEQYNQDQAFELLDAALAQGSHLNDLFLYTKIPSYIAQYQSDYETLYSSWQLAICKSQQQCDVNVMEAYARNQDDAYIVEQIKEQSDQIALAIKKGDKDMLRKYFH